MKIFTCGADKRRRRENWGFWPKIGFFTRKNNIISVKFLIFPVSSGYIFYPKTLNSGWINSELILIWTKTSFRLKWSDLNWTESPVQFSISSVSVSFQYQFIIAFFTDLFEKFFHFTTFIYCNIQICDKDTSINNFEFMRIFSFIIGKNSQWIDDTLFKTMCYLEIYWSLNFEKLVWRIGNIQVNH